MHNFIADFRKGGDFFKSYWVKWSRNQVAFFHVRTAKGAESNIFTYKLPAWQLFLNKPRKRQIPKLSLANCAFTWAGLASSAIVTFISVLHEKGQPGAAICIERLEAMRMSSVLPAVLFLAWFIRQAAWQAWLLGKFPHRIPAS